MHPDDLWNQGLTRSHLGLIAWRAGDPEEAETQLLSALRVQALIGHVWGQATTLERLGCLASSREEAAQAAQFFGVVDTLWEALQMSGYPGIDIEYPAWAVERKHAETHARETLGNARYEAIWRAAHRLGFDHAVAQLLCTQTDLDRSDKPLLTPREVEIARLIADGATNTEISVALMISKETVKTHVRSMLSKLGYTSRVQIGAWYAREAEDR
jgi:non-specific serine/threonine protein kinase